ncbi:MAG: beta-fructofuranosidase, partial [Candidatus Binatia bacterium]
MYSNRGFRESEIGDIDVIRIGDTYHLFHLILPNHDYIAHATSTDCINWTRVKSALFVGDPGEWDDDMLWTMNVSRARDGGFEMFYTGLSQKEKGRIQRI